MPTLAILPTADIYLYVRKEFDGEIGGEGVRWRDGWIDESFRGRRGGNLLKLMVVFGWFQNFARLNELDREL